MNFLKKIIEKLHLWLGLASGLVVFVLGITGSIYTFEEELKSHFYKDKLKVEEEGIPLPLGTCYETIKGLNSVFDEMNEKFIKISTAKDYSILFTAYKEHETGSHFWLSDHIDYYLDFYVDPYSGKIIKAEDRTFEFFHVVIALHYCLFLDLSIGKPIVGWATLIFVILLITGIVLWWPKNKKALKVNTWFRWKSTTKWKRKNYDLHNIVGFYSMFFALIIALTGMMIALSWFSKSVSWLANGGETIEKEWVNYTSNNGDHIAAHPLDIIHKYLIDYHSDAKWYLITLPQDSSGSVYTRVVYEYNERRKDVNINFDLYTGELLGIEEWKDKNNEDKVWAYNLDIHTGAIGGLVGKTIAFFLSLFSASLPVTGFYIWWGRRKKKKAKPPRKIATRPKPAHVRPRIPSSSN